MGDGKLMGEARDGTLLNIPMLSLGPPPLLPLILLLDQLLPASATLPLDMPADLIPGIKYPRWELASLAIEPTGLLSCSGFDVSEANTDPTMGGENADDKEVKLLPPPGIPTGAGIDLDVVLLKPGIGEN